MGVKTELGYIHILRAAAASAVIVTHALGTPYMILSGMGGVSGGIVRCIVALCFCAVPVFVMISGALFLNPSKEIRWRTFYGRNVLRIFLAIILWVPLFAFIKLFVESGYTLNLSMAKPVILAVATGSSFDHMWYLYMILGIYLVMPLARVFVSHISDQMLYWSLLILFLFSSIIPFVCMFFSIDTAFKIPVATIYPLYLLLGYVIASGKCKLNPIWCVCYMFAYAAYLIYRIASAADHNGQLYLAGINYASPLVCAASFSVFYIVKSCRFSQSAVHFFSRLSPYWFGVYILHPLPIHFIYRVLRFLPGRYPAWAVFPAVILAALVSSLFFVFILCKVPVLRRVV